MLYFYISILVEKPENSREAPSCALASGAEKFYDYARQSRGCKTKRSALTDPTFLRGFMSPVAEYRGFITRGSACSHAISRDHTSSSEDKK